MSRGFGAREALRRPRRCAQALRRAEQWRLAVRRYERQAQNYMRIEIDIDIYVYMYICIIDMIYDTYIYLGVSADLGTERDFGCGSWGPIDLGPQRPDMEASLEAPESHEHLFL